MIHLALYALFVKANNIKNQYLVLKLVLRYKCTFSYPYARINTIYQACTCGIWLLGMYAAIQAYNGSLLEMITRIPGNTRKVKISFLIYAWKIIFENLKPT